MNEPGFDVFTANKRSVLYMTHAGTGKPVAYVAIGAMLVRLFHRFPSLTGADKLLVLVGWKHRMDERSQ